MPDRLRRWNADMNDLPQRAAVVVATLLAAAAFVLLWPYLWPFFVALLLSQLLELPVRLLATHARMRRGLATAVSMALFLCVVGLLLTLALGRLSRELLSLLASAPAFLARLADELTPRIAEIYRRFADVLPPDLLTVVDDALSTLGQTLGRAAGTLSGWLTSGAVSTASSIPGALLSVVVTVMGTYYCTADRERIAAFFRAQTPAPVLARARRIGTELRCALFGQLKSQLTVSAIITAFLVLGFGVYGQAYGLLLGLLIGLADALPVVGAGLFLLPWCAYAFLFGQAGLGVFLLLMYVGTVVIRQICEPRILGRNLGLYPLATMLSIFAGYRLLGFAGLLGGPILLNLLTVVLRGVAAKR